jgi:23S rRNA pseudouridine1911/1915/1917 synthase
MCHQALALGKGQSRLRAARRMSAVVACVPQARRVVEALGRPALHAATLGFSHPLSGERLQFEQDPPKDWAATLAALRH